MNDIDNQQMEEYLLNRSTELLESINGYKQTLQKYISDTNIDVKKRWLVWFSIDDEFKEHSIWMLSGDGRPCRLFFEKWNEYIQQFDTVHFSDKIYEFYKSSTGVIDFDFIRDELEIDGEDEVLENMVLDLLHYILSKNCKSYDYAW